ncbi:MAG: alanine racemase [Arsenophonus sp.]|nr:MAG: alanine racemase [Arsenophonus sp.]
MKLATAIIDRSSLCHNVKRVREIVPKSRFIAIVKANAYGHGLLETAVAIENFVDCFGVARITEAIALREYGIKKPILLLEGFFDQSELLIIIKHKIDVVIHSIEQLRNMEKLEIFKEYAIKNTVKVWMKLDTGMHRLGIRPEEGITFYNRLTRCRYIEKPINIISHFYQADNPECPIATNQQLACFNSFIKDKPGEKSIAASAGILFWPESYFDWVRIGIIMYGSSPKKGKKGKDFGLLPAMTLKSNLIAIRKHYAGETVGYNGIWLSSYDTTLGVVAIGYGDGYPGNAPEGTPVLINGRRVPIVGKVSMDMILVDLGRNVSDKVGDEVIIWGNLLPVEEIASYVHLSNYELLTKLTSRVKIEYLD